MSQTSGNWHVQYPEHHRHWGHTSEPYAGGDSLLTLVNEGWHIATTCYQEDYWHAGTRLVTIFHFQLVRGDETMTMPVLTNPYVRRIIREQKFTVLPLAERSGSALSNESTSEI